jgi:glycosyltransferase 2 family protein
MKLARIIGFGLVGISVVYFLTTAWRHADSLPPVTWNISVAITFCAATLLYLSQFIWGGIAWHLWLISVREPSQPMVAVALFSLSQIAKYVPGNIAQHVARVALGRKYGLGTAGMVVTIALEQGCAMVAGIAMVAATIAIIGPVVAGLGMTSLLRLMLIGGIALLTLIVGIWLVGANRPGIMDRWLGPQRMARPGSAIMVSCFALYCANFIISGWIIEILARRFFGAEDGHMLVTVGVFVAAWMAGWVAIVSPGGVGVREAVIVAGLTPVYGAGTALGVAVCYRVVTSLGDGIGFFLGFFAEKGLARIDWTQS